MPSCKYCNEPMDRKNDHLKVSFYMCPKCGARGPSVKMDHLGWKEELDAKTLGLIIDAKTPSAGDDLRHRNAVLSARYSRLKSSELPGNSWLQRDVNNRIRNLQNERSKMDKVKYLKELAHLYGQKATYLEYKTKYENELSFVRHQIRVNKKKLDEIRACKNEKA